MLNSDGNKIKKKKKNCRKKKKTHVNMYVSRRGTLVSWSISSGSFTL